LGDQGAMRFILIDRIMAIETGRSIRTVKNVSLAEEYLADHFPTFPVLPGVLLLEGLVESASWLVRTTEHFAHSMVLLQQARNVKYKSFLAPGAQIEYNVQAKEIQEDLSSFTGEGTAGGQPIVEARFTLRHFNLADRNQGLAAADAEVVGALKARLSLLRQGEEYGH
jgi:3-hydroxyacyl-[acyl-carrier-protein] dehydratase